MRKIATVSTLVDAKFEAEIEDLCDKALRAGEHVLREHTDVPAALSDKTTRSRFLSAVHVGFGQAQGIIVERLLKIQGSTDRSAKWKEAIYRGIMDGIAWQMIKSQLYVARRLYRGQTRPTLAHSNIESVRKAIVQMVGGDSTKFALMSDLTSFVQVGDVLFNNGKQLVIAEVKEGEKNRKIMDFAHFIAEAKCGHAAQLFYEEEGRHGVDQLLRMVRQVRRMGHVAQLVNTGRSHDPDSKQQVYVPEEAIPVETFDHELSELIESSKAKGWAISVIDDCLFLGAYRAPMLPMARHTFETWFGSCGGRTGFPVAHLRESMLSPLALPIFCRQIRREHQFDVLFGRCVVFVGVQVDAFIELAAQHGVKLRWTSRKEAAKLVKGPFFRVDNRVLVVEEDKHQMVVGDGVFFRMMFHGITPQSGVTFLGRSSGHRSDAPSPSSPVESPADSSDDEG